MPVRPWLVALMILALSGLPTHIFAACKIGRLAELPVTMSGLRPLRAGLFAEAVAQYDKWITAHDSDARVPDARNARCWARASALRLQPHSAWSLYGRGLAKVRKGSTSAGEADIAAATVVQPRIEHEARKRGIAR